MLAEFKAQAIHFVARRYIEGRIPLIPLEIRDGATLDGARALDQEHGNFRESAHHYYSILRNHGKEAAADALIGLSQELINLGSFKQVRQLLRDEPSRLIQSLSDRKKIVFEAQCEEKLGWVEDYELGHKKSMGHFEKAGTILCSNIERRSFTDKERDLFSTTRHFLGRQRYFLARLGIDREYNRTWAINRFREAMDLDELYEGIDKNGKLGFSHAWIARCHMLNRDMTQAQNAINLAGDCFRRQMVLTPQREGYLVHQYLLEGERDVCSGSVQSAREHFMEAIRIRQEVEPYPKGLSDAYLGIARTYLWKNPILFTKYMFLALNAHPYTLFRGLIGG